MATDHELENGIRVSVQFDSEKGVRKYDHAVLRYSPKRGGLLQVPMEQFWENQLWEVSVAAHGMRFYIPVLDYRAGDFSEKQKLNTFQFDEMLICDDGDAPERVLLDRVEISVDTLGRFIGNHPIARTNPSSKHDELNCLKQDLYLTEVPLWQARAWLECGYDLDNLAGGGYEVRPQHKLILDLDVPVAYDGLRDKTKQLSTFWEFLMHRPMHPGQVIYRSKEHGRLVRHVFKDVAEPASGVAHFQTGLLSVDWEQVAPYLHLLLNQWVALDHLSAWMESLGRVIQYRELPVDIRLFMAYTALQGFSCELGKGRPLNEGREKDRMWKDLRVYWDHLLFSMDGDPEAYVDKLIDTRHHFAHLSKGNRDILRDFREQSAAYFRLMILLKVLFMDAAGIPFTKWKSIIEQWAVKVQFVQHPLLRGERLGLQ